MNPCISLAMYIGTCKTFVKFGFFTKIHVHIDQDLMITNPKNPKTYNFMKNYWSKERKRKALGILRLCALQC
jgi:hypothetical protein